MSAVLLASGLVAPFLRKPRTFGIYYKKWDLYTNKNTHEIASKQSFDSDELALLLML